jgi:hypothetical protein
MGAWAQIKQPHEDHIDERTNCHGIPKNGWNAGGDAVAACASVLDEGVELP